MVAEPQCPFCNATAASLVSLFGSQLLLSQYRCRVCGSYFEGVREDRMDPELDGADASRSTGKNFGKL